MRRLLIGAVRLYQIGFSPLLPPSCRFTPSCSAYAIEALERYGAARGSWLAIRRISPLPSIPCGRLRPCAIRQPISPLLQLWNATDDGPPHAVGAGALRAGRRRRAAPLPDQATRDKWGAGRLEPDDTCNSGSGAAAPRRGPTPRAAGSGAGGGAGRYAASRDVGGARRRTHCIASRAWARRRSLSYCTIIRRERRGRPTRRARAPWGAASPVSRRERGRHAAPRPDRVSWYACVRGPRQPRDLCATIASRVGPSPIAIEYELSRTGYLAHVRGTIGDGPRGAARHFSWSTSPPGWRRTNPTPSTISGTWRTRSSRRERTRRASRSRSSSRGRRNWFPVRSHGPRSRTSTSSWACWPLRLGCRHSPR